MRKNLLGTILGMGLLLMTGAVCAQVIPIDDIQVYNPDGTPNQNDPPGSAPYWGEVVTIEGIVYVYRGLYNNGTHYIQGDTGGMSFYDTGAPVLNVGDLVQVTGTVDMFPNNPPGEIQIEMVTNVTKLSEGNTLLPTEFTISQLVNPFDWELVGEYAAVTGTVEEVGSSSFFLADGGDRILVYIDSTTGIDIGAVEDGDTYKVIGPVVNYPDENIPPPYNLIELKPAFQGDLIENPGGDQMPVISNVNCDNWCPESNEPVEVTATITDDNTVAGAQLYFRDDNDDSTGAFTPINMLNTAGDTYAATIPVPHTQSQIHFYIGATDNSAQTSTNPGNAPDGWYEVAVGFTPIREIQYAHPDSSFQGSQYAEQVVNVRGIVTAGNGDCGTVSRMVIQEYPEGEDDWGVDPDVGEPPNSEFWEKYKWTGLLVFDSSGSNAFFAGDEVRAGGYVDDYYGLTELETHNGTSTYLVDFGNQLPPPVHQPTRILSDNRYTDQDGDPRLAEPWECVWVRTTAGAVMDTLFFGEYVISDVGQAITPEDSLSLLNVDPGRTLTYEPDIGDVIVAEGFLDYEYATFQVSPFTDAMVSFGITAFEDLTPMQVEPAGGFTAILPNPFNPIVKIQFVLNREDLTQLNIYDIRGQLVKSLVSGRLPAAEHTLVWDGTDLDGRLVSSGTYFARLRINTDVLQVQKLSLVK